MAVVMGLSQRQRPSLMAMAISDSTGSTGLRESCDKSQLKTLTMSCSYRSFLSLNDTPNTNAECYGVPLPSYERVG